MPKKQIKAKKKIQTPKVRKILLPPDEIVRIIAPPGIAPVVAIVAENIVEIIPAKKKTLWQTIFG